MDARQVLKLLRWKEAAELEMTEHEQQRHRSPRANALAIVVGAQLLGVKQQLIHAHAAARQRLQAAPAEA